MRLGLLLALVATVAEAQRLPDRPCEIASRRSSRGGVSCGGYVYAQFEFAPVNGTGMGAACACTTPTGAKGETLTFTRASDATCTKGNTTSGIANGDLVVCSTDQPAVMPGGDGTGGLGLLVEGAATNGAIRSQEFDNAAWNKAASGIVAPPTVTANYAVAPDGTTTADRVQFAATPADTDESIIYQTSCPAGTATGSVYLKGTSASGSVDMFINQGGTFACATCSYAADSWTRCLRENANVSSSGNIVIGNEFNSAVCGGAARPAADVLVWQADCTELPYATSPIPTAGTAVTRAATYAVVDRGVEVAFGSLALTRTSGHSNAYTPASGFAVFLSAQDAASTDMAEVYSGGGGCNAYVNGTNSTVACSGLTGGRSWVSLGAALNYSIETTAGTAAAPAIPVYRHVRLGNNSGTNQFDSVIKAVCVDSDPARCR